MATRTMGSADEDWDRLAQLVEHFGTENPADGLCASVPAWESVARAERLRELQARNAERVEATGDAYESLLANIQAAYKQRQSGM